MQKVTCRENYLVQFQMPNLQAACITSASKYENIEQVTSNMLSNCDYLYATCDTKALNSINNLIYS